MMQHHKYSLTELNEMMPWEREIYVAMLIEHIKDENEKAKKQQASQSHTPRYSPPSSYTKTPKYR